MELDLSKYLQFYHESYTEIFLIGKGPTGL